MCTRQYGLYARADACKEKTPFRPTVSWLRLKDSNPTVLLREAECRGVASHGDPPGKGSGTRDQHPVPQSSSPGRLADPCLHTDPPVGLSGYFASNIHI